MVIEEPLLGEILVTSLTDERPFSGVNPVVDVKMRFPGVSLLTNCAYKRFLAYKYKQTMRNGFLLRLVICCQMYLCACACVPPESCYRYKLFRTPRT